MAALVPRSAALYFLSCYGSCMSCCLRYRRMATSQLICNVSVHSLQNDLKATDVLHIPIYFVFEASVVIFDLVVIC